MFLLFFYHAFSALLPFLSYCFVGYYRSRLNKRYHRHIFFLPFMQYLFNFRIENLKWIYGFVKFFLLLQKLLNRCLLFTESPSTDKGRDKNITWWPYCFNNQRRYFQNRSTVLTYTERTKYCQRCKWQMPLS